MKGGDAPEIKGWLRRTAIGLLHVSFRFTRGMTLGVRAVCQDEQGRLFLVRHTYVPGWYLPGGGVERDETALEALEKELREEGNLIMTSPPKLVQIYLNRGISRRDHVLLYRVTVRQTQPRLPDMEIAQSGFFALDDLPEGVTAATLQRLEEIAGSKPFSPFW